MKNKTRNSIAILTLMLGAAPTLSSAGGFSNAVSYLFFWQNTSTYRNGVSFQIGHKCGQSCDQRVYQYGSAYGTQNSAITMSQLVTHLMIEPGHIYWNADQNTFHGTVRNISDSVGSSNDILPGIDRGQYPSWVVKNEGDHGIQFDSDRVTVRMTNPIIMNGNMVVSSDKYVTKGSGDISMIARHSYAYNGTTYVFDYLVRVAYEGDTSNVLGSALQEISNNKNDRFHPVVIMKRPEGQRTTTYYRGAEGNTRYYFNTGLNGKMEKIWLYPSSK